MTSIGRFVRTVSHLRAAQVVGRLRFRLQRPRPDPSPAPALRPETGEWVLPARRQPSLVGPARFRFLNVERALNDAGWDNPGLDLLWRYNLHYFDDINAIGASGRHALHRSLVQRWVVDNAAGTGTGWAPYPTSVRIVNWIKWFVGGAVAEPEWIHSLAVQTRWLAKRIEWHLLGNHLFVNAKALIYAGLFFDGDEARLWLSQGAAIVEHELREQILSDGGHAERSPMYHALALEDLLDLVNLIGARGVATQVRPLEPTLRELASAMLRWLRCLTHPDGMLALFNDTAQDIAPSVTEIDRFAAALGVMASKPRGQGVISMQPSGYLRMARDAAVLLIDAAPIGPDHQPGHAHADTLAFEMSLGNQRIIVNRGTSCYGIGARRLAERGTASHSTVQLGAHDSSEVWSGFRVGRRARPSGIAADEWMVAACHDGYRFLAGRPIHCRRWQLDAGALTVEDRVDPAPADAVARYHFAPGLVLQAEPDGRWLVLDRGNLAAIVDVECGAGAAVDWLHGERFGDLVPAQTLVVSLQNGLARVRFNWNR